jgi:uncharacterized membrane protein YhaH (DUF805 family)
MGCDHVKAGGNMSWYLDVLKNYAAFDGRAGREEYWHFTLLNLVVIAALFAGFNDLCVVYTLAVLIPSVAVTVRRLHDIDRSGWWGVMVVVLPVLIFLLLQDGGVGQNRYGFNPKDVIA